MRHGEGGLQDWRNWLDCGYNFGMRTGFTRGQGLVLILAGGLALAVLGAGGWLVWEEWRVGNGEWRVEDTPAPAAATRGVGGMASGEWRVEDTPTPEAATDTPPALPSASPAPFDPLACLAGLAGARDGLVNGSGEGGLLAVQLDGKRADVRLIGVDPAGPAEGAAALLDGLAGKTVRLLPEGAGSDELGHPRYYALVGQTFLNYELVRRGAALPALYPPGAGCLEALLEGERLARADGLGYWSLAAGLPTPPGPGAGLPTPPCDCAQSYACTDFKSRPAAQACYNACGDYRNTSLDPDHNGLACEELP